MLLKGRNQLYWLKVLDLTFVLTIQLSQNTYFQAQKYPFSNSLSDESDWNSSHCITSDLPTPERARTAKLSNTNYKHCFQIAQSSQLRMLHAFVKCFCKFWPMSLECEGLISRKLHNSFYKCCPWGGLVTKKKSVLLPRAQEAQMYTGKYIIFLLWRMVWEKKIKWSCLECSLQIWHFMNLLFPIIYSLDE